MAGNIIGDIVVKCGDGISTYVYAWENSAGNRIPGNGFTSRSSQQGDYPATNCDHFYIEAVNLLTGYDRWEVDLDGLEFNSNTQVAWGYSGEGKINVRCTSSRGGTLTINGVKQSSPTYTLTFDANGGSNAPDNLVGNSNNGYKVTIPRSEPTPPEGYTFVNWNTSPTGSGMSFKKGEEIDLDIWKNLTLYAQWEKNPITGSIKCTGKTTTSLTFEWSKSSNSNGSVKLIYYGATLITKSTGTGTSGTVEFTGLDPDTLYTAELWCDGSRIESCYGQTSSRPKTYTIYYNLNRPSDATGAVTNYPNDESFEDGYAIVSAKTPECAGYCFKEWNTKKDGTGAGHSHDQGSFPIVSDITLYAIWQCYICFHGNCNDIVDNIPYNGNKMWYDVGTEFTIPKTKPTRGTGAEWSFLYWESSSIGTCSIEVTITLTESVDLYAKWERNAKLAKPIVTKHSKTETSITVRVDKNDGYGGTWCVRIWKNGNGSWGNYLQATGDLAELPSNITFYNLDSSTLYDIQAVHSADGLGALYSEARSIRTNIPAFYWTGSNENDATYITKDKDLSGTDEASPLKAEKWNELTKLIQTCQTINSGGNTYFTSASKGTEITAQIFNEVAYALGDLNGGAIPAKGEPVKAGEDILASYFAGYGNSLKETINGISENINKKT